MRCKHLNYALGEAWGGVTAYHAKGGILELSGYHSNIAPTGYYTWECSDCKRNWQGKPGRSTPRYIYRAYEQLLNGVER